MHLLGVVEQRNSRWDEAESLIRQALALRQDAVFFGNLGIGLQHTRRLAEAEAAYRRALELKPDYVGILHNLGLLLHTTQRLTEAEASYRRALQLDPANAAVGVNLGLVLLAQGRYAEAWPCYEYRYHPGSALVAVPDLSCPPWRGEALAGKSLVIFAEQGYGDFIQFVRYAPLLKQRGLSRLTLVCPPPLTALLATAPGVDQAIDQNASVPAHDFWSLPLSLPLHLGTTLATLPAALPYLHALPARIARWRDRLPQAGLKVGLVWQGYAVFKNDAHRSLPGLATLAPLWAVPGVSFVSLQKERGEEEAQHPPADQPLLALGTALADFADSAAIIVQLDLVICVDTAVAHLAGALGKPCWVLLPAFGTDWRWLTERSDSPWYPDVMRLFRQATPGNWSETVAEVAAALAAWTAQRA